MSTMIKFTVPREEHPAWRMQANGRKCPYCEMPLSKKRGPNPPSRDHAFPASRGGTDDRLNIEMTCIPCNISKGSLTPEEFRQVRAGLASRLDKMMPERRQAYPRKGWVFVACGLVLYPVKRE